MKKLTVLLLFIAMMFINEGCDIQNPGPISAESLHSKEAIPGIVVGMSADFSRAFRYATLWGTIWAGELTFSGTYAAPTSFVGGHISSERVGPWWGEAQKARWEAEHGIEIIKDVLTDAEFNNSKYVARAYLWAGYSNRSLGFNACKAVINGRKAQSFKVYFKRAKDFFSNALEIAKNIGNKDDKYAAIGGLASVYAALGDWGKAANYAEKVPVDYVFNAVYSDNTSRENNLWYDRTIEQPEYTVYGTKWAVKNDPRLPQKLMFSANGDTAKTVNGSLPWIKQLKYTERGSDIPLTRGVTMFLVRAEKVLRIDKDINVAMALINKERNYFGLGNISASSIEEAWDYLESERGKVLWLQGRRFWDLRRWFQDNGPAHNDFLKGRDKCAPIGIQELNSNPNL